MTNQFLTRLKLIDHLDLVLDTSQQELAEKLSRNVERNQSDMSDMFSSSNHEYKGSVSIDGFSLRKRKRMFDLYRNFCQATGRFHDAGTEVAQVNVSIEINALTGMGRTLVIVLAIFYGLFFCGIIAVGILKSPMVLLSLIGLLIHAFILFGIFYLIFRKSIRRMKYDLERDLFFIVHSQEKGI